MITIVAHDKVKNDPRQLVYHFPSIPNVKMSKILNRYFYYRSVRIGEEIAQITGHLFVPAEVMHWRRKNIYVDRRVCISGRYYYVLLESEMTKGEKEKYAELIVKE